MSIVKCWALAAVACMFVASVQVNAADTKAATTPTAPAGAPKKKDPKDMNADEANDAGLCPICKGEFKPVYHYEYLGKEYHFKTRKCCQDFIADPKKYGAIGAAWKSPNPAPTDDPKPTPPKKK